MDIVIKEYKSYNAAEILNLYNSVGWCSYTKKPKMLEHAFEHSLKTFGAHDGNKLVGIIRAVGDGYSVIYIQDILVRPEYQRRGIGRRLLQKFLECYPEVYQTVLSTDDTEKTNAFYRSCGFIPYSDINCIGFCKIKY